MYPFGKSIGRKQKKERHEGCWNLPVDKCVSMCVREVVWEVC